jgi:cyclophilin family peptidyl-prolyl cis-trans isomerase
MAHAGKDTEGSQFFFTHTPCPHLDGGYTAFGRVSEGMDVVRSLQIGDMILGVELSDAPPVPAKPAKP